MSPIWVGDATGARKAVTDPWVGDGSGVRRQVQQAWVGDATGVPRLVYRRSSPVDLAATAPSYSQVNLSWTGGTAPFVLKRGSTTIFTGSGTSKNDTGLAANTTYTYTLTDAFGSTDTLSIKTPARTTAQTTVTLPTHASGSWDGSNNVRDTSNCYYGYYSSVQGYQKSLAVFNVPAAVRNCVSVDKVEISWYNIHHYKTGGRVSMVVHWTYFEGSGRFAPAKFPGSSGPLLDLGSQFRWAAPKPGYIGGGVWADIGHMTTSGRSTIKDEFRTKGAVGLGLIHADTGQAGYGYAENTPELRITYTYWTG